MLKNAKAKNILGFFTGVLLFLLIPAVVIAAEFTVIANKSVPSDRLTKDEIKAIYLGKKTKWSDGKTIRYFLIKSPKSQRLFLDAYLEKTPEQYESYWMQNVFTGKGEMPDMLENSKLMTEAVARASGSIGFTLEFTPNDNIKIINVE